MKNINKALVLFFTLLLSLCMLYKPIIPIGQSSGMVFAQENKPPSDHITDKYGFNLMQEVVLGRTVSYALLENFGNKVVKDEKLNRYVNLVGQSIAKVASNRPQVMYRFGIFDSDEVNAFACPGGYIYVTKGLLNILSNENELAAVLAHEIGHVENGDGLQDINEHREDEFSKLKMDNMENNATMVYDVSTSLPYAGWYASYYSPKNLARRAVSSALSSAGLGGYGGYYAHSAARCATDTVVDLTSEGLKELVKQIGEKAIKRWYYKPISPEVEFMSDSFSFHALSKAGYDPNGMVQFLETMALLESMSPTDRETGVENIFTYRHPSIDDRIQNAKMGVTELEATHTIPKKYKDKSFFEDRLKQNTR